MPEILLGIVVLILGLWAVNAFSKADPKQAARLLRALGGGAALLFAVFLLFRGEIGVALPVGIFGLGLLGWVSLWPAGIWRTHAEKRRSNLAASAPLFSKWSWTTTAAHAWPRAQGKFEGAALDTLDRAALLSLLGEIDDDSRKLLAAYLDRREPGWREHAQGDAAAGGGPRPSSSGKMTEEEAYQILGIQPGASAEDISRAHRALMKKLHPDQGGTTYLAARINEAKDVLIRRHR